MTVTLGEPEWLSEEVVRLSWSSSLANPTYYIWLDGELLEATAAESVDLTVGGDWQPVVDVFDSASDAPEYVSSGRTALCWWPAEGAGSYRVEEYVASAWVQRASIADGGAGFFSWLSRVLEDVTTHEFRVVAIDSAGNDGASTSFSVLMVRHPDVPGVSYSYDSDTNKVAVAAA